MEILKLLPKNILSQVVGKLVNVGHPSALALWARDWFIERYNIDMSEAEHSLEEYPTIAKLFTRKLKPGLRRIGEGFIHPCDGRLTHAEKFSYDNLIQAKGKKYSLSKLLADTSSAQIFADGTQFTYYLCPTDYHRVHSPVTGQVTRLVYVPGHLWPVNEWSVQNIDELFSVNERLIFHFQTLRGPVALVMVGATNVGKITVSFDPKIVTNSGLKAFTRTYKTPVEVKKGEEIGVFNMGSTVVVIYSRDMVKKLPQFGPVKMGESL